MSRILATGAAAPLLATPAMADITVELRLACWILKMNSVSPFAQPSTSRPNHQKTIKLECASHQQDSRLLLAE